MSTASTKTKSLGEVFVTVYCKYILPIDITKCILIFLNGDEGIPGIMNELCGSNNTVVIPAPAAVTDPILPWIDRVYIQQYFDNANPWPTKHQFYMMMKTTYNASQGVTIKLYRYFSRVYQSPEGATINNEDNYDVGQYQLVKSSSDLKQYNEDNKDSIDKSDVLSFRNIFNGNQAEMMYYWLNVRV
eukprot:265334_1